MRDAISHLFDDDDDPIRRVPRPKPQQKGVKPRQGGRNERSIGIGFNAEELAMLDFLCEADSEAKGQVIRRLIRQEYHRRQAAMGTSRFDT